MVATLATNAFSNSSGPRRVRRQKIADGRWRTRFAKLIKKYGVVRMSKDLQVDPSVIYQWIRGTVRPRPEKATTIIMLVKPLGRLRLEEIYAQREVSMREVLRLEEVYNQREVKARADNFQDRSIQSLRTD